MLENFVLKINIVNTSTILQTVQSLETTPPPPTHPCLWVKIVMIIDCTRTETMLAELSFAVSSISSLASSALSMIDSDVTDSILEDLEPVDWLFTVSLL